MGSRHAHRQRYYGKRKALSYGIGGDRTHQTLWRVQNGIFDGISPKLVALMMGVNNVGRNQASQNTDHAAPETIDSERF